MLYKATSSNESLAIGELSRLTGISTHTLRMWERRYGSPKSMRLPSGHRRYMREDVPRLRTVVKVLNAGHQPRKVVASSLEELENLLNLSTFFKKGKSKVYCHESSGDLNLPDFSLDVWMDATHRYDNGVLDQGFFEEWSRRGPMKFVTECAAPFVDQVGNGWEAGELSISQEHFASERISDFLGSSWRRLNERNDGPVCVMTTLPKEEHQLGLQMCAVIASLGNWQVIYLGINTPFEEIISSVLKTNAKALCVSISRNYPWENTQKYLLKLSERLDSSIRLIGGGAGFLGEVPGIVKPASLQSFHQFCLNIGTE